MEEEEGEEDSEKALKNDAAAGDIAARVAAVASLVEEILKNLTEEAAEAVGFEHVHSLLQQLQKI